MAALLDDLEATGLLGDTLVLAIGEFGRSPRMGVKTSDNPISPDGRDHWPWCSFGLFAGGGVRGGQLIGNSDSIAAYPITTPYSFNDVARRFITSSALIPRRRCVTAWAGRRSSIAAR